MTSMTVSIDPQTGEHPPAAVPNSRIRTRADAEAYVASVCFKCGPPRLLGVELEWTVHHADDPRRALDAEALIRALGPHAPDSLVPDSPRLPLPNGSALTVEPGGQVEVSSLPATSMRELFDSASADAEHVRRLLAAHGLVLGDRGTDPWRSPQRVLHVPRYAAMECAFDRIGIGGRLMMCSTAGVQVCVDIGEPHRVAHRWAALHALGPVCIAAFANSPELFGEPTGWASARTRSLLRTDAPRMRPGPATADPAGDWARRVLDTALLCRRSDGADWRVPGGVTFAEWIGGALPVPPTYADLDYHLTTLFPPVRPRGYFEVRYLDAQGGDAWMLPAAALFALMASEDTVDEVLELAAPTAGRWVPAARAGLADPALARTAAAVLGLACRCLDGTHPELAARLAETVERNLAAAGA